MTTSNADTTTPKTTIPSTNPWPNHDGAAAEVMVTAPSPPSSLAASLSSNLRAEGNAYPEIPVDGHHHHPRGASTLSHSISITGVAEYLDNDPDDYDVADKHQLQERASGVLSSSALVDDRSANLLLVNASSSGRGARVLFATDEWFASADNLLSDAPPHYDPKEYCQQGKVMDGWETRRRREAGHDWCLVELSDRVQAVSVEFDTAYFTGNHAPSVSVEMADLSATQASRMASNLPGIVDRLLHGCLRGTGMTPDQVREAEIACRGAGEWTEILPRTPLRPGVEATRMHLFAFLKDGTVGTHLRLNYYPDGGVARMRLWGHPISGLPRPVPPPAYAPQVTGRVCTVVPHDHNDEEGAVEGEATMPSRQPYRHPELSLASRGGKEVLCSNRHYGRPSNLIQASLGRDMGDGWETARHPDRPAVLVKDPRTGLVDSPLLDWCVLKLGSPAVEGVSRIILDTRHFSGNYPESVQVHGCYLPSFSGLEGIGSAQDFEEEDPAEEAQLRQDSNWFPLVARCRMSPDSEHVFDADLHQILSSERPITHVRVSIYPDGGLSRVRVYGEEAPPAEVEAADSDATNDSTVLSQ
jgi:allantoicase